MNGAKSARPTLCILLFCMFRLLKDQGELSFSNLGCLGGSFNTNMQITLNFTIMFNFSSRALVLDSTRAFHNFQVKLIHICVKLRCSGHLKQAMLPLFPLLLNFLWLVEWVGLLCSQSQLSTWYEHIKHFCSLWHHTEQRCRKNRNKAFRI